MYRNIDCFMCRLVNIISDKVHDDSTFRLGVTLEVEQLFLMLPDSGFLFYKLRIVNRVSKFYFLLF